MGNDEMQKVQMRMWKEAVIFIKAVFMLLFINLGIFAAVFRHPSTKWKYKQYDCAVVCGYFANADGTPTDIMKKRVEKAVKLLLSGRVKSLIFSGAAVYNQFAEAEVMREYALKLGAPEACIVQEKHAVSTYHNILYSERIMRQRNFKNCVVVTNKWHLRKADHYARKFHLDYVMSYAADPEGQTRMETLMLHARTNINMYINMFRGYY